MGHASFAKIAHVPIMAGELIRRQYGKVNSESCCTKCLLQPSGLNHLKGHASVSSHINSRLTW
jgi:hypothetical protein